MNIRFIRSFLIFTLYNTFSSRIFPSKTKYEFLPQWRFSSLFSFILLVEGIFSFFRKWRLRIENENGKRHRPSLGEWKRGGVRAGVREHCLTRANKYEKPFNGLRTGPNTFLPPHTNVLYSFWKSTNPIPYMPRAQKYTVFGHILPASSSLLVHYLINYYTRITKIPSFLTFQMRIKTYASIQTHLGIFHHKQWSPKPVLGLEIPIVESFLFPYWV